MVVLAFYHEMGHLFPMDGIPGHGLLAEYRIRQMRCEMMLGKSSKTNRWH